MRVIGRIAAAVLAAVAVAAVAPGAAAQDDEALGRELARIAEEQDLLRRQVQRLRQTMEVLLPRLEAEGRVTALELLREGLGFLDERNEELGALTLEEAMEQARIDLEAGQPVRSLEQQEQVVQALVRLLAILENRSDLESLEQATEQLRAIREALSALADREADLRDETGGLREASRSEAQSELDQRLSALLDRQRALLGETEERGRESGSLSLEEVEHLLAQLLARQETDRAVLESWDPGELAGLEEARPDVERARGAGMSADRLRAAARKLRAAADAARRARADEDLQPVASGLETAAELEERHGRVSGDERAEATPRALRESAADQREAGEDPDRREAAAAALDERAAELERLAREEDAAAQAARAAARESLDRMAASTTVAGDAAREAAEELERAMEAAEPASAGSSEAPDPHEAGSRTDRAAQALREGIDEQRAMGPVLARSQSEQAGEAERLDRQLEGLPLSDDAEAERAGAELERAAEEMDRASSEAAEGRAQEAARAARSAEEALRRAQEALAEARRAEAGRQAAEDERSGRDPAEEQRDLAREAGEQREAAERARLEPEAEQRAGDAMERAQEAMESAAEAMEQGRTASATASQREAVDALQEARQAAQGGSRPTEPADRQRADELAREQEEIRRELLDLATRNREREGARPLPGLDEAAESAAEAAGSLTEGDLPQAERQEEETERKIRDAMEDLAEEEEQYQRLRQEELLFRITEEVQGLIAGHQEAMAATREVHSGRDAAARPTRSQRLRLRRIASEEAALGARAGELADAIEAEGALVFTEILSEIRDDLERIAERMDQAGEYQSGERVQLLQQDVLEALEWLWEALQREQERRRQEEGQGGGGQQDGGGQNQEASRPRLVEDFAELKLLRRMELESLNRLRRFRILYPDLDLESADPFLLQDLQRLAERHERTSELFRQFTERLGIEIPDVDEGGSGG